MNSQTQSQREPDEDQKEDHPEVQGEGNYDAARRHRESVEKFVDDGKVKPAADAAAPDSAAEEREMKKAEEEGRERAKS